MACLNAEVKAVSPLSTKEKTILQKNTEEDFLANKDNSRDACAVIT